MSWSVEGLFFFLNLAHQPHANNVGISDVQLLSLIHLGQPLLFEMLQKIRAPTTFCVVQKNDFLHGVGSVAWMYELRSSCLKAWPFDWHSKWQGIQAHCRHSFLSSLAFASLGFPAECKLTSESDGASQRWKDRGCHNPTSLRILLLIHLHHLSTAIIITVSHASMLVRTHITGYWLIRWYPKAFLALLGIILCNSLCLASFTCWAVGRQHITPDSVDS